jgi:hypothetical protein
MQVRLYLLTYLFTYLLTDLLTYLLTYLLNAGAPATVAEACAQDVMLQPRNGNGNGGGASSSTPAQAADSLEESRRDALRERRDALITGIARGEAGLNESQCEAMQAAMTRRLTLIQGPPGTGKTSTSVQLLAAFTELGSEFLPVLACSDSNIAVDNLLEGLDKLGVRVVRMGRSEAIRPELEHLSLDSIGDNAGGGMGMQQVHQERKRMLERAQVICCTCAGAGSEMLEGKTFPVVLVDEASQATEPIVTIPVTRGARQLILVGDHCQLPPTVLSDEAGELGLNVSLYMRLVTEGKKPLSLIIVLLANVLLTY